MKITALIVLVLCSWGLSAADYRVPDHCKDRNFKVPPPGKGSANDPCLRDLNGGMLIFLGNDVADTYEIANCNLENNYCKNEEIILSEKEAGLSCKKTITVYSHHFEEGSRLYSRSCRYELPKSSTGTEEVKRIK